MSDSTSVLPAAAPSERPALRPDVVVHPPADGGASWVVQYGSDRYFRVGADLAALLTSLDGDTTTAQVATKLGAPWSAQTIDAALERLACLDLLDDGTSQHVRPPRRFNFRPPFVLQVNLFDPSRVLGMAPRAVHAIAGRPGQFVTALLGLGGLLALAGQAASLRAAMLAPLPIAAFYAILAGLVATTFLHELGHGCVLVHHGGRPRRLGMMLFYLMPAFYCDVSDGWRLGRREQRVGVALAGIVTQCAVAGASAIVAAVMPDGDLRVCLLVFAVTCYLYGLVNLVPLVKLDGYIALMSYLDIPHLRTKAIADAQRAIRGLVAGTRERRELSERWWAVPYGLGCLLLPPVLVVGALSLWETTFFSMGRAGAALCLLLLLGIGFYTLKGATHFVNRIRRLAHSRTRLMISAAVFAVGALALLSFLRLPYDVRGGYVVVGGHTELALPPGTDTAAVTVGSSVSLQEAGLALRSTVGRATIAGPGAAGRVAMSVFVPVRSSGVTMPAQLYPLADVEGNDLRATGAAVVHEGSRPLGSWLVGRYVSPVLRSLAG